MIFNIVWIVFLGLSNIGGSPQQFGKSTVHQQSSQSTSLASYAQHHWQVMLNTNGKVIFNMNDKVIFNMNDKVIFNLKDKVIFNMNDKVMLNMNDKVIFNMNNKVLHKS